MDIRIVDLTADRPEWLDRTAALLHETFRGRTRDWQDLDSARETVIESLAAGHVSRIAVDDSGDVAGWIAAAPIYDGHVWEIHPLVVGPRFRRQGIGRSLVRDLEALVEQRGGLTLYAGSDDEHRETTLGGVDLYADLPAALRDVRNLGAHPYEFYLRLGFTIVGVLPDANGPGKPDIFLAKPVRGA